MVGFQPTGEAGRSAAASDRIRTDSVRSVPGRGDQPRRAPLVRRTRVGSVSDEFADRVTQGLGRELADGVRLLAADPDLAASLPAGELELARQAVVLPAA